MPPLGVQHCTGLDVVTRMVYSRAWRFTYVHIITGSYSTVRSVTRLSTSKDRVMSEVDMGRVSVTLPVETIRQIDEWAGEAGLKRGQFTSVALVIGAKVLARQLVPERFMDAAAWKGIAEALGVDAAELQGRMNAKS